MGAFWARFQKDTRGGAAVVFALALPVLLSATAAAVDLVSLTATRAKLQDVADAAALQAVREIALRGASDAQARESAENAVAAQVETTLGSGVTVTPTVVIDSRDPARVTVTLDGGAELPIGLVAREGQVKVEAQAQETERVPVSLLLLEPTAPQVWRVSGTSDVISIDGVAHVNSSSASALSGVGDATVQTRASLVVGPDQAAGNWTPPPIFNVAPLPDPWAAKITWPNPSSCDSTNRQVKNTTANLTPGVYCGGLSVRTHGVANLAPGVYVLKDGDLEVDSGSELNAPEGVTIVLTGEASAMQIQSGAQVTLKAPTSGPWTGLAIAVAPQSTVQTSTIIGGGELSLDGVVYIPSGKLLITGGGEASSLTGDRIFVVNRIEMSGNGQIYLQADRDVLSEPTGARLTR